MTEETSSISGEDIVKGLRSIGIKEGMKLVVHSSLSKFGFVEGGPISVIEALKNVIGKEGTLMLPTFDQGRQFSANPDNYWDILNTNSNNGIISDTFWRMNDVVRSLHPTHSWAVWGQDKEFIVSKHNQSLCMGEDSPIGIIARKGGHLLHLGTDHSTSTAKHMVEMLFRSPCLGQREREYRVKNESGEIIKGRSFAWRSKNCPLTESGLIIEKLLDQDDLQVKTIIGRSVIRLCSIKDFYIVVKKLLDKGYKDIPACSNCEIRPSSMSPHKVKSDFIEDDQYLKKSIDEIVGH